MSSILHPKKAASPTYTSNIIAPHADGYITVTRGQLELLKKFGLLKQIGTRQVGGEFEPYYAREVHGVPTTRQELMFRCYLIDPPIDPETF